MDGRIRWSPEEFVLHRDGRYRVTRRLLRIWVLIGVGFSVFLVRPVAAAVTEDRPVAARALLVLMVVAYGAGYIGLSPWALGRPLVIRGAVIAWMLTLYVAQVLLLGPEMLLNATYVLAVVAVLITAPWSFLACTAVVACVALLGVALGAPIGLSDIGVLVTVAIGSALLAGAAGLYLAVHEARAEIARLAVDRERDRVFRDLHDVLGHSLTTITVKAGLARRMLESGSVDRLAAEVADVERLGRAALAEVRATVAGRRIVLVADEVAAARETLRAAGIAADLPEPGSMGEVAPDCRGPFGHVVREGVTNVVRHSGASRCTVRVGPGWVEVRDDGRGPSGGAAGSGLRGLATRMSAIGGRIDAGPLPGGGYRLRAEALS